MEGEQLVKSGLEEAEGGESALDVGEVRKRMQQRQEAEGLA